MKEYLTYLTLTIAVYGAVLSTFTFLRGRRRLKLSFEMGILILKNRTMVTSGLLKITNLSSVPVYIKEYGFEIKGKVIQVNKIPSEAYSGLRTASFDMGKLAPIELYKAKENLIDEVQLIQGGQSVSQHFYAINIKKNFLEKPKSKILGYCVDQTGKKYFCKTPKKLILSIQEPGAH